MSYKYLDHLADVGILAEGESWPQVFEEAGRAMFHLIAKVKKGVVGKQKEVKIEVSAKDIEALFIEWLNELLAQKDLEGLFFIDFKIDKIEKVDNLYKLQGRVFGQPFNEENFVRGLDVKAATYSGLKCEEKKEKFFCQCILDV